MQLVGNSCFICQQTVVFAADATWCGRCRQIFHICCLAEHNGICPHCHERAIEPSTLFVYSLRCPACGTRNAPGTEFCRVCKTDLHYETLAEYQAAKSRAHRDGTRAVSGGVLQLAAAGLLFLATIAVAQLLLRTYFLVGIVFCPCLLATAVWLAAAGVKRLSKGVSFARFK